jgi:hypothetical protein
MINIIVSLFALIILNSDILYFIEPIPEASTRIFIMDDKEITVTHNVDDMFYGLYQGDKTGYLLLKRDGTGEYKYDIFGVASSLCKEGIIHFEWGVPVNKENRTVKFKKPYGFSYPVIFKCSGEICFQGCSKVYLLDFILDKEDGKLHVSSSDDWKKEKF